jgi:hypothetical protein
VRQAGSAGHRSSRRRGHADAGSGEPLPFTGLALIILVLVGGALVIAGARLRRSARAAPTMPVVVPTAAVVGGPTRASVRTAAPPRTVRVAGIALVGLAGLAFLASQRRA